MMKFEGEGRYYSWIYRRCVEKLIGGEGENYGIGNAGNLGHCDGLIELKHSDNV
jgi:hypothetical protein